MPLLSHFEALLVAPEYVPRGRLLDLLPIRDVIRLGRTSSLVHEVVVQYTKTRWNIDRFLQLWFWDTTAFRAALAFTGAVIGGSQALRFMDRLAPAAKSDLDVVTRVGGVLALSRFLEDQGYNQAERPTPQAERYPIMTDALSMTSSKEFCRGGGTDGIIDIVDFEKPAQGAANRYTSVLKVQLIVVTQNPIHHIIYTYHSTVVMNYINHKEAVSVFPRATFCDRTTYPSSRKPLGPGWDPVWKTKYEKRGFRTEITSSHPSSLILGERWVKDGHSMCIQLQGGQTSRLQREEKRSQYTTYPDDKVMFELSLLHEKGPDEKERYRLGVFEPEVWDYLYPWYILQ
ncbi:hypothetical protein DFP72DRAFT_1066928 [Ephemerocybe angulata]|uniref:Uncharacterized protein n=1 Tax=Ephemerocybe angulata TaxID=980116 RepID=A0A8H6HZT6_9AGAR|nr:hypothetical protein DFP72DRAFT_1066928 [Tulosesus angulatus]